MVLLEGGAPTNIRRAPLVDDLGLQVHLSICTKAMCACRTVARSMASWKRQLPIVGAKLLEECPQISLNDGAVALLATRESWFGYKLSNDYNQFKAGCIVCDAINKAGFCMETSTQTQISHLKKHGRQAKCTA